MYINNIFFSIITQMVMGKTVEPDLSGEHKVLGSAVHPTRYVNNCSRIYQGRIQGP